MDGLGDGSRKGAQPDGSGGRNRLLLLMLLLLLRVEGPGNSVIMPTRVILQKRGRSLV